jgi:hypothetical protein
LNGILFEIYLRLVSGREKKFLVWKFLLNNLENLLLHGLMLEWLGFIWGCFWLIWRAFKTDSGWMLDVIVAGWKLASF